MSQVLITIVFILLALTLLGLGWIITGKSRIRLGMCGRDPTRKKKDCGEDVSCTLCEKKEDKK